MWDCSLLSALRPIALAVFSHPKESVHWQTGFQVVSTIHVPAECFPVHVSRQQLLQLVLDAAPAASPPAPGQCAAAESHSGAGAQPEPAEGLGMNSFLRKDRGCTSTKAELACPAQKSFKTEEHHDLHSTSAEVGGKDSKVGSQEIPGCAENHEKPSTSVVKGDRKGEVFGFCLCPALSPTCGWLCVSQGSV